jgi:hypothetical protein
MGVMARKRPSAAKHAANGAAGDAAGPSPKLRETSFDTEAAKVAAERRWEPVPRVEFDREQARAREAEERLRESEAAAAALREELESREAKGRVKVLEARVGELEAELGSLRRAEGVTDEGAARAMEQIRKILEGGG